MYRYFARGIACALLSGLPMVAVAGPQFSVVPVSAVPADSFIVQPVGSTPQLTRQISLDPVVRRRLARHFHTSAPAVTRYIQDNLVLKNTTVAQSYGVYCVSRAGQEYRIVERLPAGTPVFVLRTTGRPILKLACGNPMVASLPPVARKAAPHLSPKMASAHKPPVTPAALPATLQSKGPALVPLSGKPGVVIMPITRVSAFLGAIPVTHGGSSSLGYLAGLPVLALFAGHGGHSGSTGTVASTGTTGTTGNMGTTGNSGTTGGMFGTGTAGTLGTNTGGTDTYGTNTGSAGTSAVPEPGTPVTFAVGGLGVLIMLSGANPRRRKRNRTAS